VTETLKQVIEQAEQLPPELQQVVAEQFQQVLDAVMADARWETLLNDSRRKEITRQMAQEALEEYKRGETEEGGFGG
jgi:L-aminopeptidase/D-esterase-like protein